MAAPSESSMIVGDIPRSPMFLPLFFFVTVLPAFFAKCADATTCVRDTIAQAPGKALCAVKAQTAVATAAVKTGNWLSAGASTIKTYTANTFNAIMAALGHAIACTVGAVRAAGMLAVNGVLVVGCGCLSIWEAAKVLLKVKANKKGAATADIQLLEVKVDRGVTPAGNSATAQELTVAVAGSLELQPGADGDSTCIISISPAALAPGYCYKSHTASPKWGYTYNCTDALDSEEEGDDMASTLPAVPERELPWLSNPLSCNPLFDDNQCHSPIDGAGMQWNSMEAAYLARMPAATAC